MSENLLLHRRPAPNQRTVPSPVAQPRTAVGDRPHPSGTDRPDAAIAAGRDPGWAARSRSTLTVETAFAARNSPVDLLFRGLWQLVGVYVYLVLVIKDRKLPR